MAPLEHGSRIFSRIGSNLTVGIAWNATLRLRPARIHICRAWLASSVLAAMDDGSDNFFGTDDDTKDIGTISTRHRAGVFSTIASLVMKGQPFGSAATGAPFGIVAEQVKKAQIGKVKFGLDKANAAVLLIPLQVSTIPVTSEARRYQGLTVARLNRSTSSTV